VDPPPRPLLPVHRAHGASRVGPGHAPSARAPSRSRRTCGVPPGRPLARAHPTPSRITPVSSRRHQGRRALSRERVAVGLAHRRRLSISSRSRCRSSLPGRTLSPQQHIPAATALQFGCRRRRAELRRLQSPARRRGGPPATPPAGPRPPVAPGGPTSAPRALTRALRRSAGRRRSPAPAGATLQGCR
jgi:hypothetical protein